MKTQKEISNTHLIQNAVRSILYQFIRTQVLQKVSFALLLNDLHLKTCLMSVQCESNGCALPWGKLLPDNNIFLIRLFYLHTAICSKCQNVFPSSHNVHLKIRIEIVNGKFECEPNKVYKGYIGTRIWLTCHSIRSDLSHSL